MAMTVEELRKTLDKQIADLQKEVAKATAHLERTRNTRKAIDTPEGSDLAQTLAGMYEAVAAQNRPTSPTSPATENATTEPPTERNYKKLPLEKIDVTKLRFRKGGKQVVLRSTEARSLMDLKYLTTDGDWTAEGKQWYDAKTGASADAATPAQPSLDLAAPTTPEDNGAETPASTGRRRVRATPTSTDGKDGQ